MATERERERERERESSPQSNKDRLRQESWGFFLSWIMIEADPMNLGLGFGPFSL